MDGKLTAIPSSTVEADGGEGLPETPVSCRKGFDKAFPIYLAMGMSYDEFYCKDHTLVIAYREAYKRKCEEKNRDMWLQGLYVYEAISRVSPLLIPFNKHPKPMPYLDKPFPIMGKENNEEEQQKAVADKGFAYMQAQMMKINAKFGKGV